MMLNFKFIFILNFYYNFLIIIHGMNKIRYVSLVRNIIEIINIILMVDDTDSLLRYVFMFRIIYCIVQRLFWLNYHEIQLIIMYDRAYRELFDNNSSMKKLGFQILINPLM
jgi:hypothetical protein